MVATVRLEKLWTDRRTLITVLAGLLVTSGLLGCAGSKPASEQTVEQRSPPDTTAPAASGAGIRVLAVSDRGLLYREGEQDREVLAPADELAGAVRPSPSGRYLTAAVARGDSAALLLVDRETRTIHTLDRRERPIEYSAAWAPEGDRVAFGYYVPRERESARDEWAGGGVRTATLDGETRSVGCRSAKKVLHWLPDGSLAVRSRDDLFVVASEDCGTISSQDARRLVDLTYSPDGTHLAYIYRDLVYDEEAVEYVPDSTLFLAQPNGKDSTEIVGDSYRARHLRFAPDGSELAFDVRSQEDSTRRQVIVYEVAAERLTYLIPPDQAGSASELHPRFSPSGDQIAYTVDRASGRYAAVRNVGRTTMLGPVDRAVWGWIGEKKLVVPGPEATRVVDVNGETVLELPPSWTLVDVWETLPS